MKTLRWPLPRYSTQTRTHPPNCTKADACSMPQMIISVLVFSCECTKWPLFLITVLCNTRQEVLTKLANMKNASWLKGFGFWSVKFWWPEVSLSATNPPPRTLLQNCTLYVLVHVCVVLSTAVYFSTFTLGFHGLLS